MTRRDHSLEAALALVLLRMVLGGVMLLSGLAKMTIVKIGGAVPLPMVSAEWQQSLPARVAGWAMRHPEGALGAVARDLIVPNGALFAGTVAWTQLLVGVLLIVGLWTRWAALIAGMIATLLAAAAMMRSGGDVRGYLLLGAIALAVLIGNAGIRWGMDGWRSERRRNLEL
jgi:uncharacterized membrane protein YphA (DoxX/SURF4 family)